MRHYVSVSNLTLFLKNIDVKRDYGYIDFGFYNEREYRPFEILDTIIFL